MTPGLSKEAINTVRAARARGLSVRAIAAETGLSIYAIYQASHTIGCVGVRDAAYIEVPAWVPDWMRAEYRENARTYGEEAAARYARRDKAEAAR